MAYDAQKHSPVHHGRRDRNYKRGETLPYYGLMRLDEDGNPEFLYEDSFNMSWRKDRAMIRFNPLSWYHEHDTHIINFNKEKCPFKLGNHINRCNYLVKTKDSNNG
jgi:hypothetical protein